MPATYVEKERKNKTDISSNALEERAHQRGRETSKKYCYEPDR